MGVLMRALVPDSEIGLEEEFVIEFDAEPAEGFAGWGLSDGDGDDALDA